MLKIKLKKIGRKRINAFRVIAASDRRKRNTKAIVADIGFYKPQSTNMYLKLNTDTYKSLILQGAQPTLRVKKLYEIACAYPSYTCIAKQAK